MSIYGDDYISLTDDEGKEFELRVLDEADLDGVHYYALTESEDPEGEENLEIIILKSLPEDANGEVMLSTVDDEDELQSAYELFEERMFSDDDDYFEDDEDDE